MNSVYYSRRKNHLCVDCGKQDEETLKGKCRCIECAKKQREKNKQYRNKEEYKEQKKANYEYLKNHQRCVACGKQDAFTLNGYIRCADCSDKHKEKNKIYNKQNREEISIKKKELYQLNKQYRIENHLCVTCGKELEIGSQYKTCERCRYINRKRKENERINNGTYPNERGEYGICYKCNKEKALEGKRLCQDCYNQAIKALEIGREKFKEMRLQDNYSNYFIDNNNLFWKQRIFRKALDNQFIL